MHTNANKSLHLHAKTTATGLSQGNKSIQQPVEVNGASLKEFEWTHFWVQNGETGF